MNVFIKNEGKFEKVVMFLHKEKFGKEKIKLDFNEEELCKDVDVSTYKYISFKSKEYESPKIPLNEKSSGFNLANVRDNLINVLLYKKGLSKTGEVLKMNVKDVKNLFYRPGSTKRVFTFIPSSYDKNKKYALLIALDGQNLFSIKDTNKYTSKNDPFGSWQLDTSLALIKEDTIVVSIDNADKWRNFELLMDEDFGDHDDKLYKDFEADKVPHIGRLNEIGRFIVENLIPYAKENYSIDESQIGIIGSSSGGIAAFYLGMEYSDIFTHIFAFSPALNLFKKEGYEKYFKSKRFSPKRIKPLVYFYYGGKKNSLEKELLPSYYFINDVLHYYSYPNSKIINSYNKEGNHNEMFWRYECLNALKYFK